MNIRKIAVVGSFAAGAALAFAPIAAADTATDIFNTTVDTEVSALNSIFVTEADFAGVGNDIITHTGSFDTIPLADAPLTAPFTTLDYELYGFNPAFAGPASDPGSYNVFNGALTEFYDAYNSDLYGLLNGNLTSSTDLIPAADLFGSSHEIGLALATGTDFGAATTFFEAGLNDLAGFFDLPSLF